MRTFLLPLSLLILAADWPRFRGPNGQGHGDAAPATWTARDHRLWTIDLPGKGHGSPIVVRGKLFLQSATSDERTLHCFDAATGRELWKQSQSGTVAHTHRKNSLASSTPACDGTRVVACFWDGNRIRLAAYDLNGKTLWSEDVGLFVNEHGAGMSPVLHDGKVYLNFDHDKHAEIIAYDAATGKKLWSQPRKGFRASYSTPIVRDGREIVVLSTAGLSGYDPATGALQWDAPFTWGRMALRAVASPVQVGEVIVCLTGDGGGSRFTAGVIPGREPKVLWKYESSKIAPYVPSPVAIGKHLYWITDQGKLECVDPRTGKVVWRESVFNATVSASPVVVGDTLLLIDEAGKAIACKVDANGYTQVGSSEVGEAVIATPAVADGRVYIRGAKSLLCIGKN